jgi:hypothetical protein
MRYGIHAMLAMCVLLGAGCVSEGVRQAYAGAALPDSETCALVVPAMLDVRAIDGVPTDWSLRVKSESARTLRLLPGTHRLWVRYYDPSADEKRREVYEVDRIEVTLQAAAQSVHELRYETWTRNMEMQRARQKVRVWVATIPPGNSNQ